MQSICRRFNWNVSLQVQLELTISEAEFERLGQGLSDLLLRGSLSGNKLQYDAFLQ